MPRPQAEDPGSRRGLDALGLVWLVTGCALFIAIWPGWELPGRIPREYVLILAATALALGRLATGRCAPLSGGLAPTLPLFALAGLAGLFVVPAAARADLLWALAPLFALWALALFASRDSGAPPGSGSTERALSIAATLGCAFVGALALAQSYLGVDFVPQVKQPAATFMQRNVLGQTLVVALPLAFAAALAARHTSWRWMAYVAAALGAAALVATRSRGAWIALACALALGLALALVKRVRVRADVVAGAALVVAAALLAGVVAPAEERRLPSVVRSIELLSTPGESSVTRRAALMANSVRMSGASPLVGHGAGRFGSVYPLFHDAARPTPGFGLDKRPEHAHNEFLHTATELGIPVALLLAFVMLGALYRHVRGSLASSQPDAALWQAAAAVALAGVLVHAQVSFPLRSPTSAFLAFALAGVAWRATPSQRPARSLTRVVSAESLVLLALIPAAACIPYDVTRQQALGRALERFAGGEREDAATLARAPSQHRFRARTRGLAAMVIFEGDRDARRTLPTLEAALSADPHNLNLLLATGARRLKAGHHEDALEAFRYALSIDATLGRAWLGVAMVELERGSREKASEACLEALFSKTPPPAAELFCVGNGLVPARPGEVERRER